MGFSEERSAKARAAEGSRFENAGLERAPVSASLSPACQPMEGEQVMKRSVVALGILGLVCAVALPGANAAVLLKDDFSTDALLKSKDTHQQGFGSHPQD